jgi:GT2 family glycosyltransferase
MARVDTVIVSYNSRDTLLDGVRPLLDMPDVSVTVVDNASADGSLDVLAGLDVRAIQSGRNGGFGFGCNLGAAAGVAPYVLFLNPDARIEPADLERLVAVLDVEPEVAIVGPRLLDGSGGLIPNLRFDQRGRTIWARALFLHRLMPRSRWWNEINRSPEAHDSAHYPEWVSGACMLVRRSVLERIRGFDERFFLYCEDMDLCMRARAAGGLIRYEPDVTVRHQEGRSAPRTSLFAVLAQSRSRYARKHSSRLLATVQRIGLVVEALTHVVANLGRPAYARGYAAALRATLRRDVAATATGRRRVVRRSRLT